MFSKCMNFWKCLQIIDTYDANPFFTLNCATKSNMVSENSGQAREQIKFFNMSISNNLYPDMGLS